MTPLDRPLSTLLACLFLSVAGCAGIDHRVDVAERVEAVSEQRLRSHVDALVAIGPRPSADEAATQRTVDWLVRQLRDLGYEPRLETFDVTVQTFTRRVEDGHEILSLSDARPGAGANVIAELTGRELPESVVEISAHYDTVLVSPGADDNSSGVAGLLEVARLVRDVPCRRTIRFCLFAAEEIGLVGSGVHVERMPQEEREQFAGLLNLEMIGSASGEPDSQTDPTGVPLIGLPGTADFIAVIGNFSSGGLGNDFEAAIDTYVPELPYFSANRVGGWFDDAYRSDHANYWRADLPAIMINDTGEFRMPHYHRRSDLPLHLDFAFMRGVTQATLATTLHLAEPIGSEGTP